MGNSSDKIIGQPETTEGERHDRCDLDLPGVQEDFIREIAALNRHTVVVLQNGSAVTMQGWIGDVNAVLEAWYAGSECGHAIAEVLFGDHNPAGRLPITFPTTTGQCPLYYNPRPHGRVSDYCDHRGPLEQFAFGYGLSYSRFEYSGLRVRKTGKGRCVKVDVTCTIRNAGRRAGDEVVQLYLRDCYSRISRPIKELRGFERIHLKRGESGRVAFTLGWDDFAYLGEDMKPVLEPGDFKIMVGASSADIRLERSLRL
jgi:beta-glucosidase